VPEVLVIRLQAAAFVRLGPVLFAFSRSFPRGSLVLEEMKRCGAATPKKPAEHTIPKQEKLAKNFSATTPPG